jgi:regulator of protease activity HflC (stomatin/prohibitin superfamily)
LALHLARGDEKFNRFANPLRFIALIMMLLGVLTSCIVQIDAGQVGVKKLFGKIQPDVLNSGLHFINPLNGC